MRIAALCFCFSCFVTVAWSQVDVKVGSEPSPMEAFAKGRGVRTIWSNEVGRLDHNGTRVVLTALVMEDRSLPTRQARGVRVDLSKSRFWPVHTHDHIYLDEEATNRTRAALEEITDAVAGDHNTAGRRCMGARDDESPASLAAILARAMDQVKRH